ncbi:MAG: M48 family metalloprotease [Jatrophihabitantaceae bacterium]
MEFSVYLPFLLSGLFGVTAPLLARRLPPAVGTWLLSVGGLLNAAGAAASLMLLGFTLVAQSPLLAERGRWSESVLRQSDPVSGWVAGVALIAFTLLAGRFLVATFHRMIALRDAYRLAASLPPGGELAVIDDAGREAYAVPGRIGRIVVSSGLLRSLDGDERRAVLAHERAHLVHRHHLHLAMAHLAAAANPLLWRLPAGVALSTERWADESAAATCRRDTVARALTQAATGAPLRLFATVPAAVLAAAANEVLARVHAMNAPAPKLTLWRVGLLVALLVATTAAVMEAAHDTERLFEMAQFAYRSGHR